MSDKKFETFGDAIFKKASRTAQEIFLMNYNKTEEECNTSKELDAHIVQMLRLAFLLGVKSCLTKPDEFLSLNDTIKNRFK